jgi:hypothetical protein
MNTVEIKLCMGRKIRFISGEWRQAHNVSWMERGTGMPLATCVAGEMNSRFFTMSPGELILHRQLPEACTQILCPDYAMYFFQVCLYV